MKTTYLTLFSVLLLLLPVHLQGQWTGKAYGDGWVHEPWFGVVNTKFSPWIWHLEHGWLFSADTDGQTHVFFDQELNHWFWTAEACYPWVYLFGTNHGWYRFENGSVTGQMRHFYRDYDRQVYSASEIGNSILPLTVFTEFITRSGDKLMEGNSEFRFLSFNIPNIHIIEDPVPAWHRADPWEQEDAVKTISQMGGQVFRMYCFSIKGGVRNGNDGLSHVYGPGEYDEELFRDLDYLLYLCNIYGIRIIIPFIDNWEWFGGDKQFAAFYGKAEWLFYLDPEVIDEFKDFISFVINRRNTVTGMLYRDDPAILCWELGNELDNSNDAWISEIAAHLKSEDPNHLVMDGQHKPESIRSISLSDPNIDICTVHYQYDVYKYRNQTRGIKPFFLGEFIRPLSAFPGFLDDIVQSGISGAMVWSLRFHNKEGGFYFHDDGGDFGDAFHWPGFRSTLPQGEHLIMPLIRQKAYEIRGLDVPPLPVPDPPFVFPVTEDQHLRWRGSTGAASYIVEKALEPSGPWVEAATGILDTGRPFVGYLLSEIEDKSGWLRMRAVNQTGISLPSNTVAIQPSSD